METFKGALAGLFGAAIVVLAWGLVFDRIGHDSWFLSSFASAILGAIIGLFAGGPYKLSDDKQPHRGLALPLVALVIGAAAALAGDLAAVHLRSHVALDAASIAEFARTRDLHHWFDALLAGGAAAAVSHRMVQTT